MHANSAKLVFPWLKVNVFVVNLLTVLTVQQQQIYVLNAFQDSMLKIKLVKVAVLDVNHVIKMENVNNVILDLPYLPKDHVNNV